MYAHNPLVDALAKALRHPEAGEAVIDAFHDMRRGLMETVRIAYAVGCRDIEIFMSEADFQNLCIRYQRAPEELRAIGLALEGVPVHISKDVSSSYTVGVTEDGGLFTLSLSDLTA